jgi:hydroxymethylglutaryl-CoA synthase
LQKRHWVVLPFVDEDAVTASVEAGKLALIHAGVDSALVGKVYVGTESNPYAVKPIASKVAQVLIHKYLMATIELLRSVHPLILYFLRQL